MGPLEHDFRVNGYAVIYDFLQDDTLERLRRITQSVLRNLPPDQRARLNASGNLCNFGDHPEFADIVAHPAVERLMEQLGFSDFTWLVGYLYSIPGKAPPLFWHQDWWGWSEPLSYYVKPPGIGFIYFLSDSAADSGCLRVIPGSHRRWHQLHEQQAPSTPTANWIRNPGGITFAEQPDEVTLEVSAGDLVIIDSRLLHSTHANATDADRSLLTLWYVPEFAEMPAGIRNQLHQIFTRHDRGTEAGGAPPRSPLDWPSSAQAKVAGHIPVACPGNNKPILQRRPDRSRMRQG